MKIIRATFLVFLAATVLSCSSMKKGKADGDGLPAIRYINLRAIYSYVLKKDEKAAGIKSKKDETFKKIEDDKLLLLNEQDDSKKIYARINKNRDRLKIIEENEEKHKGKILNYINVAVKKTAESIGADFIFNLGEEVVYGNKKYDVTEDVIKELERIEKRSDPVSR